MSIAVVAEKPSVARDIARALGVRERAEGCLRGQGYLITWAFGHLVVLAQPHEIHAEWKSWRRTDLPLLPEHWPLIVDSRNREQFTVVRDIINAADVEQVVCATDAGREGELIFRYIYEAAECRKPVRRLWISSLTPDAIRQGFARLRDGSEFDALADAARGRSRADWLVGMNLSRACTLMFSHGQGDVLSVGRVQTPTLAMLVERDQAIRNFVPEDYREVVATFAALSLASGYTGTWFRGDKPTAEAKRLPATPGEAEAIAERAQKGKARVETRSAKREKLPPPLLYDLTELQRHANRLYGFKAQKTLDLAQQLYEKHKLISYPRTDSRHLTQDVAATLGTVVQAVADDYRDRLAPGSGVRALGRRFVDDSKVTDHHAIIPTTVTIKHSALSADERKIHDLICRRLLMAWHEDYIWSTTTVITAIATKQEKAEPLLDRYHSSGKTVEQLGWKVLDPQPTRPANSKKPSDQEPSLPAGLEAGLEVQVEKTDILDKQTRPPPHFVDASLLTAMETAGKTLDDKELSAAMKDSGLGTPATRAETIETLIKRGYVERQKKSLRVTDKGEQLIARIHPAVKSPALTGEWEARLKKIQRGEAGLMQFMRDIERFIRDIVAQVLQENQASPQAQAEHRQQQQAERANTLPTANNSELTGLLQQRFALSGFRPYQEQVCCDVVAGKDVLLVMPTGAGKSLCYQLPGLARGGTTLVISPLIALMEDQVGKLQAQGFRAERIHSARDRASSRRVCVEYLAGRLDFLFIAPERLSVPGFPEMLAKRKPVLIAVDEAHCISHWGHDFRPDYRLLGQRLPLLRPAPVIAMTATATPLVQDDILHQLAAESAIRHIHGFRRDNIAIEIVELKPGQRDAAVHTALADPDRRPAIVYAPTRKETDRLGQELNATFAAAAYHAGMLPGDRERVQQQFLRGELDVIVATIAFGMGVDKPDVRTVIHTGLPGSLEGYYQEIGRAGRDGLPSRAILLYSYIDMRTHEFFQKRDYPAVGILHQIAAALEDEPQAREPLRNRLGIDSEVFDKALEKLWIHGGAKIDFEERITRGSDGWQQLYPRQKAHKEEQLRQMLQAAETAECRMLHLVRHFGDQEDSGRPCGVCDRCAPDDCLVGRTRPPTVKEISAARCILDELQRFDGQGTGRIFTKVEQETGLERREYEQVLTALAAAGCVQLQEDSFAKEGRTIRFRRAYLQDAAAASAVERGLRLPEDPSKRYAPKQERKRSMRNKAEATNPPASALVSALKSWRTEEARKRQVPPFVILTNRTLDQIAAMRPSDEQALLGVSGMGPKGVEKYGTAILAIVSRTEPA